MFRESSLVKNAQGSGDKDRQVGAVVVVCTGKGRGQGIGGSFRGMPEVACRTGASMVGAEDEEEERGSQALRSLPGISENSSSLTVKGQEWGKDGQAESRGPGPAPPAGLTLPQECWWRVGVASTARLCMGLCPTVSGRRPLSKSQTHCTT